MERNRIGKEHIFSRTMLRRLLIPLIIEQALSVTIGMMDTIMVSSCGEAAVSGISLVDSVNWLIIQVFAALATGGAVVVSQYIGREDMPNARKSAKQLVYIMTLTAIAIGALALLLNRRLLSLIFGNIEAGVMDNANIYMVLSALSYPFLAAYNAGAALFRSMGNSKVSMYISVGMNAINVGGNAILIFGFNMGVMGAGLATLASRVVGAAVIIVMICRRNETVYIEKIWSYRPNFSIIKTILKIGIPNGIENGIFHLGKIIVLSVVSSFGTAAIAANAICNTTASFANVPGAAIGLGIITIVGQCMGAGEKEQASYYAKRMLALVYVSVIALDACIFIFAPQLAAVYNLSADATVLSEQVLHGFALANVTLWPLAFTVPNVLRAAGDARFTMIISIASMWVFRVGSCYLFSYLGFGLQGVWIAMYCDWACRGLCFIIRFARGKWKNIKVI